MEGYVCNAAYHPILETPFQIYLGSISDPSVKEKIESATLILSVGALKSDFNTGNFSYNIPTNRTVEVSLWPPFSRHRY